MKELKKILLNLSIGEFAAVCVFIYIYILLNLINLGRANLIAFLYLVVILLQGSIYWFYKYLLMGKRKKSGLKAKKFLSFLRLLNAIVLILIMIIILIIKNNGKDLLIAIGLFLFGVIEYVNYYWYRLSYGKSGFNIKILLSRKLQKSTINKLISN